MKTRFWLPLLSALLIAPAAIAQIDMHQKVQVTLPTKFGAVNLQLAVMGTEDGKQAAAQLQTRFAPRYAELQTLETKIQDDQTRLRTGQDTLNDQARADLQEEMAQLQRSYQRKAEDAQADASDAQQEVFDRIARRMVNLLSKYSTDNGYAMVFDSSSQQAPILYSANQIDLTQELITLYDKSYPVESREPKIK
jgi:Skp family chaperone for outer membrane proteins